MTHTLNNAVNCVSFFIEKDAIFEEEKRNKQYRSKGLDWSNRSKKRSRILQYNVKNAKKKKERKRQRKIPHIIILELPIRAKTKEKAQSKQRIAKSQGANQ